MTAPSPPPLTPPDCDLRDFPFMPLDVVRLRDSDISALASGDEFRCAVLLWCASWHQVPAASVPDDDIVLAQLAGFGRVVKEWKKVREGTLRGWVMCADERLYHPVVAEKANEAWVAKLTQRWKTECARIKKNNLRNGTDTPYPDLSSFLPSNCPEGHVKTVPGDRGAVSLGTLPTAPSDKDAVSLGTLPTVPSDKGAVSLGTLPTAPSDKDAVSLGTLPTVPSDKGAVSLGTLPTVPSDKGAVSLGTLPTVPGDKGAVSLGTLPTVPSDKDAVSLGTLPIVPSKKPPCPSGNGIQGTGIGTGIKERHGYSSSSLENSARARGDDDKTPAGPAEWLEFFSREHGIEIDHRSSHDRKKFWPLATAWAKAGVSVGQMRAAIAKAQAESREPIAFLPAYADRVLTAVQRLPPNRQEAIEARNRAVAQQWLRQEGALK